MKTKRLLSDMLKEGPLPLVRAAAIGAQLAAALRDRHAEGLGAHRSVGPSKLLVRWDSRGEPVVVLREPDGSAEPSYLAPEQWAGQAVDERADVYAIGAVIVHMVQGVPPAKPKPERADPPPLAGIPDPLRAVIRRALWPSADLRPQSAGELFEALAQAHTALRA